MGDFIDFEEFGGVEERTGEEIGKGGDGKSLEEVGGRKGGWR